MGKTCFVIQPFDSGEYDKRYSETYLPAILSSGFEPYRVDEDSGSSIPIYDIEQRIAQADVCFADITVDNPNVWCEVGLAIAHKKEICLICARSRSKLPFDVQHRQVIFYSTSAASDFVELQKAITKRLSALAEKIAELSTLPATIISNAAMQSDLSAFEIAVIGVLASELAFDIEFIGVNSLRSGVDRLGFTAVAANAGMRLLLKKGLIETRREVNEDSYEYTAISLSSGGWDWIEGNMEKFNIRKTRSGLGKNDSRLSNILDEDIPF